jgi:hypothetical protein
VSTARPGVTDEQRRRNLRTAIVLALIVAAFFFGIMLKYWALNQ